MRQLDLSMNSLAETSWTLILSNPSFTWRGVILTNSPKRKTMLPSPRRDQRCWHSRSEPTSPGLQAPVWLSSSPLGFFSVPCGWRPSWRGGCYSETFQFFFIAWNPSILIIECTDTHARFPFQLQYCNTFQLQHSSVSHKYHKLLSFLPHRS